MRRSRKKPRARVILPVAVVLLLATAACLAADIRPSAIPVFGTGTLSIPVSACERTRSDSFRITQILPVRFVFYSRAIAMGTLTAPRMSASAVTRTATDSVPPVAT
jgi:hypothetical protein